MYQYSTVQYKYSTEYYRTEKWMETQEILACAMTTVLALFPHNSPFDAVYMPQFNRLVLDCDPQSPVTLGPLMIDHPGDRPP